MTSLIKIKKLAGIPIDYSNPKNAAATIKTQAPTSSSAPQHNLTEAAKVPQHRGEVAPKTKDNMRARVNHAKKALEALELARDELMDLPAVDYMEDIPTVIKQLHHMLHGEDGTGGLHHLHRHYKNEFDNTVFPEDVEEEKKKEEEDAMAQEAGITGDEADGKKKKKTNEAADVGFEKPVAGPSVEKKNVRPFKLASGSDEKTMYQDAKDEKAVEVDPKEADAKKEDVLETKDGKKPEWLEKAEKKAEKKDEKKKVGAETEEDEQKTKRCPDCGEIGEIRGHMGCKYPSDTRDEEDCVMSMSMEGKKVQEAMGTPLFARDSNHPKHEDEENYTSWEDGKKPVNVVDSEKASLYYPNGSKSENANQLSTNPYNENQKVKVPATVKSSLKTEAEFARKMAETFTMRRDWDSKNFHENLANAFDTLNGFLDKGTIYGIKEAQIFMTTLMGPILHKLPAEVVKFVAAGGTVRSLKNYLNDVKEPTTGVVFQQDSDGTK